MKETVHLFGGRQSLVGVMSAPEGPATDPQQPVVVILNSGLVHRAGPNRLSVRLARTLAAKGLTAFRFDFNGVGDSAIRLGRTTFAESAITDTLEALDFLQQATGARRFVLTGVCSGAVVALKTGLRDRRVAALIPINVREYRGEALTHEDLEAVTLHYYWRVKFNPVSWKRLFTGFSDYSRVVRSLAGIGKRLAFWRRREDLQVGDLLADLETVLCRDIPVQLIFAQGDLGLDYLQVHSRQDLGRHRAVGMLQLDIVPGADHLFTLRRNQDDLLDVLTRFVTGLH